MGIVNDCLDLWEFIDLFVKISVFVNDCLDLWEFIDLFVKISVFVKILGKGRKGKLIALKNLMK